MRIFKIRRLNDHPVEPIQTVGERNLTNVLNNLKGQEVAITIVDIDMAIVGDAEQVARQIQEWLDLSLTKENVHFGAGKD